MNNLYKIRGGFSLRDSDGKVKSGGDTIELDADMAKHHSDKVDPVQTPVPDATAADTTAADAPAADAPAADTQAE